MKFLRITLVILGAIALAIGVWRPVAVKAGSLQQGQHPPGGVLQFKGEPLDLGDAAPRVGKLIANVEFIDIHIEEAKTFVTVFVFNMPQAGAVLP